ncbi:hypothetical protein ACGK9R_06955 [Halomonas sp. HNIBRBA4712]|uniref:hypothetical protein n=1 Tax=Halomonas sp. HNIBRBA4712 TaxID=3373087 RepID=UPI0037452FB0
MHRLMPCRHAVARPAIGPGILPWNGAPIESLGRRHSGRYKRKKRDVVSHKKAVFEKNITGKKRAQKKAPLRGLGLPSWHCALIRECDIPIQKRRPAANDLKLYQPCTERKQNLHRTPKKDPENRSILTQLNETQV